MVGNRSVDVVDDRSVDVVDDRSVDVVDDRSVDVVDDRSVDWLSAVGGRVGLVVVRWWSVGARLVGDWLVTG
jgi:hypothetical protein